MINPLEPLSIVSVTLSPFNCLHQDTVNIVQCIVTGLPDPTVKFQLFSDDVDCTVTDCDTAVGIEGVVTTANLTFGNVSANDEGTVIIQSVEPLNRGHVGDSHFVLCKELFRDSKCINNRQIIMSIWDLEECPL